MEPFGDGFEDDTTGTTFRDVILLALIGFVAMVVMLLPHIHKAKTDAEDYKPPGNVIVEMHWPNDMPYDVDLWVKAPEHEPVDPGMSSSGQTATTDAPAAVRGVS